VMYKLLPPSVARAAESPAPAPAGAQPA
jgi:hypothetical protein